MERIPGRETDMNKDSRVGKDRTSVRWTVVRCDWEKGTSWGAVKGWTIQAVKAVVKRAPNVKLKKWYDTATEGLLEREVILVELFFRTFFPPRYL